MRIAGIAGIIEHKWGVANSLDMESIHSFSEFLAPILFNKSQLTFPEVATRSESPQIAESQPSRTFEYRCIPLNNAESRTSGKASNHRKSLSSALPGRFPSHS